MSATVDAERFELLAAVGDVADGTRLLGETVQRLLDIIVPAFADVATLDVVSVTGEMRRLGARVHRPRDPRLETRLLERHQSGDASVGVLRAVARGESQLLSPTPDPVLRSIAIDDEDLEVLRALALESTMYVPLRARGRTIGVLSCSTRAGAQRFTPEDLRFAEVLAGRIGLALDNAGLSETVSSLERRLETTLANLAAGVIVRDGSGRMVFANPAAAELLGAASVEELFGTRPEQLMAQFEAADAHGRPLTLEQIPSGRALRGERPEPVVLHSINRATGRVRWVLHKATPVFDTDGSLALVVNVIEDITEAKRAELAQRLLSEVGRELASSLDYEQTLQRVAQLAVPGLADWCGVSLRGEGEVLEQVAGAHVDPRKVALARELGKRFPTRVDNRSGAAEVIRTGRPQMIPEITDELLAAVATEPQLELVRQLGMRSIIIVPMALPEQEPFGVLSLVMAESGRLFEPDDLALAEELGRRAAAAIENARLYTERSRIASTLQHGLLPPALPAVPGFSLASLYRPAGAQNEVGGDFYDAFAVRDGWMVLVGDVAGHGAAAAALTALSRYTLRTAARLLGDPVAAIVELNRALRERDQLSLVSVCCAVLRATAGEATAELLLAGHPPPYHVRDGRASAVGTSAPLLGVYDDAGWETTTISLHGGDLLVLYTDGVIDTHGHSERFGERRLAETLVRAADASGAIQRIDAALSAFEHGPQRDDTAVLAVQRVAAGISRARA